MTETPIYDALVAKHGDPFAPVPPGRPTSAQLQTMRKLALKHTKPGKA